MSDFFKNLAIVKDLSEELVEVMNDETNDDPEREDVLALTLIMECKMMDMPLNVFILGGNEEEDE
jgi:hypothetical protein